MATKALHNCTRKLPRFFLIWQLERNLVDSLEHHSDPVANEPIA
jgi:hypothetical protein